MLFTVSQQSQGFDGVAKSLFAKRSGSKVGSDTIPPRMSFLRLPNMANQNSLSLGQISSALPIWCLVARIDLYCINIFSFTLLWLFNTFLSFLFRNIFIHDLLLACQNLITGGSLSQGL